MIEQKRQKEKKCKSWGHRRSWKIKKMSQESKHDGGELNRRGMRNTDILLSVGLPLTRFGAEKQDFIDYLSKNKEVSYFFEKEKYHIFFAFSSILNHIHFEVINENAA